MHLTKKQIILILAILLVIVCTAVPAAANGPGVAGYFYIYLQNLPEDTAYVDLLLPLEPEDNYYTPLERKNLPEGFSEEAPIITFHEDGYCSYTFHCIGAESAIKVPASNPKPCVFFFTDAAQSHEKTRYDHEDYAQHNTYARLAILDGEGNILQLSAPHRINTNKLFRYTYGKYTYDAATDTLTVATASSGIGIPFYFILSILGILLTVLSERMVCKWFGLRSKYGKLVVTVNLLSQFVMRMLYLLLYSILFFDYAWTTFLLEIAVFVCEYLIYRHRMANVSAKKCVFFTLTANLVSFILGFGLNRILFFRI